MDQERSAPALEQRELVIIGGGSAGFGAAYRALQTGDFRVTLIEKNPGLGERPFTAASTAGSQGLAEAACIIVLHRHFLRRGMPLLGIGATRA